MNNVKIIAFYYIKSSTVLVHLYNFNETFQTIPNLPDANSFREYILTNTSSSSSSSSSSSPSSSQDLFKFFNKLLTGQPSVPEFKLDDYYCFTVVSLRDGTATYVGFLNKWYIWSKVEIVGSNGLLATEMQAIEESAYRDKEAAIRAKGRKDCLYHLCRAIITKILLIFFLKQDNTAARSFLSAAKRFEKVGDESNLLEAANCYEDVYKAFQQIKQTDKALKALETAASIYERNVRQSTRAARVYEALAEQYKKTNSTQYNSEKALKMHRKAAELFELDGDGRFLFSLISQAELSAEIGYFEQAINLFDNVMALSADDSTLNFKIKNYIFWQCLCIIALDDWIRLEKKFQQLIEQYPSFTDSREYTFINKLILSKNSCDPSGFATACKEYDQFTTLTPWQTRILLGAKKDLEVEDLR